MRKFVSTIPSLLASLLGCGEQHVTEDTPKTAVAVPAGDTSIEAASKQARSTVSEFIIALAEKSDTQTDFSVKVPVIDSEATHVVWLQQLSFDGSDFIGQLGSDVEGMTSHSPGDEIRIAPTDIEDWMYIENGKLVGGYSLRAIRNQLSGPARESFEQSMWFEFE